MPQMDNARQARHIMVDRQISARGIADSYVLEAMRTVPRESFMPEEINEYAYEDTPLPIGQGQTISQPYIVALMAELAELHPDDRVLEIGAGSGYGAAVLSRIVREVFTIERHEKLAQRATESLKKLGYNNVIVTRGDGSEGLPEKAPFDAIIVTAGAPEVPEALKHQLETGGRLVIPVGTDERRQHLLQVRRVAEDRFEMEDYGPVIFVPLIGKHGWRDRNINPA
jgi:protein-L-isoaspartate(D-aspartate) O-methyltransferase